MTTKNWTSGTQALLNLCCVALNDEWEQFMGHFMPQKTTRLYANCPVKPKTIRLRLVA